MRFTVLYLRSRRVPVAFAAAAVCTSALRAIDQGPRLGLLAVAVAVAAAADGLGGADPDLDRTAAISWPPRRALHVLAIAAVAIGLTVGLADFEVVARAGVGLTGLAALGAVLSGHQLAWCLPVGWAGIAVVVPFTDDVPGWVTAAPDSASALVTALVLGIGGTLGYVLLGCRR